MKRNKSYRFPEWLYSLLSAASAQTDLPENEILEQCVLLKIEEVVKRNIQTKQVALNPEFQTEFARAIIEAKKQGRG
jgi:hypothetical protein